MSLAYQAEAARDKLLCLQAKLVEISEQKNRTVNVFDAIGMQTQEVKHSSFVAWLMNPNQPHKLGSRFLKKFFSELIDYVNSENSGYPLRSNREILSAIGFVSISDFSAFLADPNLTVQTEKVVIHQESRIDIFLESLQTKTVVIIENKVFSTTHDNQLSRYENELENRAEWQKIFIYLTPEGDMPNDFAEYRNKWCVFSYRKLIRICQELLRELPNTKEYKKLKILLEDYIEMVDTNVLKENKDLKRLCKQIRREHRDALDLLLAYTDNTEDVIAFCKKQLRLKLRGFKLWKDGKTSFQFSTDTAERYFAARNESLLTVSKNLKFRYGIRSAGGAIELRISIEKEREESWSAAQMNIANAVAPNKVLGEKYCTLSSMELLSEEDREKDFEDVREIVEMRLCEFIRRIEDFETENLR